MPLGLVALVEPVWGWSVRVPLASVSGASLPLPPPSTVAGALLYGVASSIYEGEWLEPGGVHTMLLSRVSRLILSATAGLIEGAVVTGYDTLRASNIPYLRPENLEDISQWFTVTGFGVTVAPGSMLCLAMVLDDAVLDVVDRGTLEASVWSASRIGSKEGLASIVEAGVYKARSVGDAFETLLYAGEGYARGGYPATMWVVDEGSYRVVRVRLALEKIGPVYTPASITAVGGWLLEDAPWECRFVPRVW